jgi:hypothetical protein
MLMVDLVNRGRSCPHQAPFVPNNKALQPRRPLDAHQHIEEIWNALLNRQAAVEAADGIALVC